MPMRSHSGGNNHVTRKLKPSLGCATAVIAASLCLLAAPAHAADLVFDTGVATGCRAIGGGFSPTGQTFTIPVGESTLSSVTMGVGVFGAPTTGSTLTLHKLTGATLGPALGTIAYSVAANHPAFELKTLSIGGGVPVVPGETYAVVGNIGTASNHCFSTRGDVYPGGSAYQTGNGPLVPAEDGFFRVAFAAPAPVPTLSEWAMILFALILAGGATLYIQRRHLAA